MLFNFLNPADFSEKSPAAYVQFVQVQAKPRVSAVFEECQGVETQNPPGRLDFAPAGSIRMYWDRNPKQVIGSGDLTQARVTILDQPKYGVLKDLHETDRDMGPIYAYDVIERMPNGTEDRAVLLVEIGGKRIKVVERLILTFNYESLKGCKGRDYYNRRIGQVADSLSLNA